MTDKDPKRKASFLVGRIRIPSSETRQVGLAFAIPGLLLAGPLVGYGFGWLADVYLGAPEWARVIGLALGFVSGVRESILAVKRLNEEQEKDTSSHD